jgi:DNA-binding beta-propeller fold protein YncE
LGRNDPSIAVDPIHNLLVVSNREAKSILVFDRNASGNAKPLRIIRGPNTLIGNINGLVVYPEGKLVMLAIPGHGIGMWSLDDDGDVPPKWAVAGDHTTLKTPFAVALNPEHKEIYVTDMGLNGLVIFSAPEIFEPVASDAAPGKRQ